MPKATVTPIPTRLMHYEQVGRNIDIRARELMRQGHNRHDAEYKAGVEWVLANDL